MVDEAYTVQVPYTVTRNVPRQVYVDEAYTVEIEVPVKGYKDVAYTDYVEEPRTSYVDRVVEHAHGKRDRRYH